MKPRLDILATPTGFLSAVALVFSPKCPFCFMAYAGILSSIGVSFETYEVFVVPLMYSLLTIAGISLFISGYHRKRYGMLILFIVGVVLLLGGRIIWNLDWMMIVGGIIISTAVVWNNFLCRNRG